MQGHTYAAAAVPARNLRTPSERPRALGALGIAGLCVLGLALVWVLAELVPAIQIRDALLLHDFTLLSQPRVEVVASFLIHLLDPLLFVLWGTALVAGAIAGGRPRVALAVVAVMGLAPLTSETLKPLLAHPHAQVAGVHIGPASWPSGHATAAAALALCVVLVAPVRLRALAVVLAAIFTAAVGCSLLILAWHMPSDVLGGYLVATFWAALAVAALRAANRRWPPGRQGATG